MVGVSLGQAGLGHGWGIGNACSEVAFMVGALWEHGSINRYWNYFIILNIISHDIDATLHKVKPCPHLAVAPALPIPIPCHRNFIFSFVPQPCPKLAPNN